LPAYIKKCLILWIPLNWLRKSDGMRNEWTSQVNIQLRLCIRIPKRQRLQCWRLTIHTFIAIITRLLWQFKKVGTATTSHIIVRWCNCIFPRRF
jgi:hypothetical protein